MDDNGDTAPDFALWFNGPNTEEFTNWAAFEVDINTDSGVIIFDMDLLSITWYPILDAFSTCGGTTSVCLIIFIHLDISVGKIIGP